MYRYIAVLRDVGLLLDHGGGEYRLSGQVIGLAEAARAAEPLTEIADPVMRVLSSETGEGVILVRLIDGKPVCVHRIESPRSLRVSFAPGQVLPLDRGASSRLLLAELPTPVRNRVLQSVSGHDPTRARALNDAVTQAGQRGWATSEQEIENGIWAVAAAVRNASGTIASLCIPSPLARANPEVQQQLLEKVCEAANTISRSLTENNEA
jgi:DNA-binding IclR family transcriptional regulator